MYQNGRAAYLVNYMEIAGARSPDECARPNAFTLVMEDRTNFAEAFLNAADWRADASSGSPSI